MKFVLNVIAIMFGWLVMISFLEYLTSQPEHTKAGTTVSEEIVVDESLFRKLYVYPGGNDEEAY